VVVLLLLGVVAAGQVENYRASTATARSVSIALAVQDLVQELQTERGLTAGLLGGNPSFRTEIGPARERVDLQRAAVAALVSGTGPVEARVRAALQQLDGLPAVRAATDAASAGRAATFRFFTDRIAALNGVDVGLDRSADAELRRGVSALDALGDIKESTAQERALLNGVFSAGGFDDREFLQFAQMRAAKEVALARFARFASPSERVANAYLLDTGAARLTDYFESVALDAADGRHVVVNPQSWWSALTTVLDDMRQLQRHVGSEIQVRAHDLKQEATQRIAGLTALVLLCLGASIYLAVLASLSITRPLAALAAEADSVAAERLPEAVARAQSGEDVAEPPEPVRIPARATSEIRSVASALDRVQSVAFGLATEQAMLRRSTTESLANLGRRNQNLLRRQLGFITMLEREELDPSGLANLFELDHLATRMRRNAASLLVLVGASSPRQWTSPVPVADVIRAAVSEVEEYRRVSLRRVDEAFVAGTAVGAVAHLLSELIENGLAFSPPDCDVEIQGRRMSDGYLVVVTDQGVGMTSEDLERANARLRGEGDFIAAPTRFLGHFVVGQLARESNVSVELRPSPVTGITARVMLPPSALVSSPMVDGRVDARVDGAAVPARAGVHREPPVQALGSSPSSLSQPAEPALAITGPPGFDVAVDAPDISPSQRNGSDPATPDMPGSPAAPAAVATAEPALRWTPGPESGLRMGAEELDVERTRNGLRKRTPRERRTPVRPEPAVYTSPTLAADPWVGVDDSPGEVRVRLSALLAGVHRGHEEPLTPAATPGGRTDVEPAEGIE
jgi:signal transduction histidine kinase